MTAIETIQNELDKLLQARDECISDYGYVYSHMKYKYQMLVRKSKEFKDCIDWLQSKTNCV